MMMQYTLTMPNVGSWDGKWSGQERLYARIRYYTPTKIKEILGDKPTLSWFYNFGDGWSAQVTAQIVAAKEAAKIRRTSVGFCNYEWMIDSIEKHGKIIIEQDAVCQKASNA
jgi:hypothetical protein